MNLDLYYSPDAAQAVDRGRLTPLQASIVDTFNTRIFMSTGNAQNGIDMNELDGQKIKALTSTANFADVTPEDLGFSTLATGGFLDAIDYKTTAETNRKFTHFQQNGRFVARSFDASKRPVTNTFVSAQNDIINSFSLTLTLVNRAADFFADANQVALSSIDKNTLIAVITNILEETKKYDLEVAVANNFFNNASVVEGVKVTGANTAPIHRKMKEFISLRLPLDETKEKSGFVISQEVFGALIGEQNTNKDFIARNIQSGFERAVDNPEIGLVGYFDTYPVYVSNGIGTAYTLTTNRITGLTGGTASAIVFGRLKQIKVRTSPIDTDTITMFNIAGGTPSFDHIMNDTSSIHMNYRAGEGILNPSLLTYAAVELPVV